MSDTFNASSERLLQLLRNPYGTKWNRYEDDVIPMWIADMDFGSAQPVVDAISKAAGGFGLGYSRQEVYDDTIGAFQGRYLDQFSCEVDPSLALLTTDVVQSIYFAISLFSEAGDSVIIQSPIYPPFMHATKELDRQVAFNPLVESNDTMQFNFEQLDEIASDPKAKILLLCNPHNPSGRVMTEVEIRATLEIASRHNLLIVADEIHGEITYPRRSHLPIAKFVDDYDVSLITLTSASKAFNLAGLRCAVAGFSSMALKSRFEKISFHMRGAISNLGMVGTTVAWRECDAWQDEVMGQLEKNRQTISDFINHHDLPIGYSMPEGTYLAWLNFENSSLGDDPASIILQKAKVALSSGSDFGPESSTFARLNFATSSQNLLRALEAIGEAITK
ncbi:MULTISPECIES: aminotransferase class I/II-fold pyridoxal phosphate-dependent enzyme [Acidithrix]|uniref:cysteine-S-conjugate beta-lyase n=1 Tax=Acidithrix ferrooxidans TaxID=1280514 RepID=A0A0D8HEH5_9ACTN|nr:MULTISPECIES: aminotransferase class I/II-fold pyridoxal phosphate-dependent enzyme [Acidithrix]KJF16212.1 cystathionine beta-lyase PatB [Acidithrix ferrooxidans]CAG4905972.1 unnamed protein product [Acidithrix sp. C25]